MRQDRLKLIVSRKRKPPRRYPGEPLECSCGSRETVETRVGRTVKDGKVSAGQKQVRCYHCGKLLWS